MSSNKYLEKVALNRLEQYVVQNLEKFPMAARKQLADKGMIRSVMQVAKGNKERDLFTLLEDKSQLTSASRVVNRARAQRLLSSSGTLQLDNLTEPRTIGESALGRLKGLNRTHEVAELLEKAENQKLLHARLRTLRLEQIYGTPPALGKTPLPVSGEIDRFLSLPDKWFVPQSARELVARFTNQHVGGHHNLAVLGRESNALRQNLYPEILSPGLAKERQLSGEADLLQRITGKHFGVDRLSSQDLRKLRVLPPSKRQELAFYSGITEPADLRPIPADLDTLLAFKNEPSPFQKYVRMKVRE